LSDRQQAPDHKSPIAFIGLGQMGLPMAEKLVEAGYTVRGVDLSEQARNALREKGGLSVKTAKEAAANTSIIITVLPNGRVVREALLGEDGAVSAMSKDALLIDMSSSAPLDTRHLGEELASRGVKMIDAPVSGGVTRAKIGTLAVMVGGEAADIERARPLLSVMGSSLFVTGPLGSAHAMKALNNYVSAAGLAAASEALIVGRAFGLEASTIVDILNASSGRNNSTETKLKPFVLSGTFGSGFGMALMSKDVGIAADLAEQLHRPAPGIRAAADLWARASKTMGPGTDHTAIYAYLDQQSTAPQS
jgi:3-hydroxyisobutyrate dehydrogenase